MPLFRSPETTPLADHRRYFPAPSHSSTLSPAEQALVFHAAPFSKGFANQPRESKSFLPSGHKTAARVIIKSSFQPQFLPPQRPTPPAESENSNCVKPHLPWHNENPPPETRSILHQRAMAQLPWDLAHHRAYRAPQKLSALPRLHPPSTTRYNSTAPTESTTFPSKLEKQADHPKSSSLPLPPLRLPKAKPPYPPLKRSPRQKCSPHWSSKDAGWPPRLDDTPA